MMKAPTSTPPATADGEVSFSAWHQQVGGGGIDEDRGRGHRHHEVGGDGLGREEPLDRRPTQRACHDQECDRVEQRGEDRGASEPIGIARGRRALAELACRERRAKTKHIGKVVPRIGDQRDRMTEDAEDELGDHDQRVQANGYGESGAERGRRVAMSAMARVAVPLMIMVTRAVRRMMIVHVVSPDRPWCSARAF